MNAMAERTPRVIVIGAGMAGLCASIDLARAGFEVVVLDKAGAAGGKMREVLVAGRPVDSGPTVLTMRHVFEQLFTDAGADLATELTLQPLEVLARHAWSGGAVLDLHPDAARNEDAIGRLAGSSAASGYRSFALRAEKIYETLAPTFIHATRPAMPELVMRIGPRRLGDLRGISPFTTLWRALGEHFSDPRLLQLFGRYATYSGSSPFLAPATLMLIAHVERLGVWRVEGGMQRLAEALIRLAQRQGATYRPDQEVAEILVERGVACGVVLRSGERIEAESVVASVDVAALASGLLGEGARPAAPTVAPVERSMSALTWSAVASTSGLPLAHHTVAFSDDSPAEFEAIRSGQMPADPTVYLCAQDRHDRGLHEAAPSGSSVPERLFVITNAPANGDRVRLEGAELKSCEERLFRRLERCGLTIEPRPESFVATSPADFARLFPGTGGALYGRASHGWMAPFRRPGSRSRVPKLYLAGGSAHPGAGLPMAAISGRLAAAAVVSDLASTGRSSRVAMPGGISMR